jgi:simple sugar transport system permease protein
MSPVSDSDTGGVETTPRRPAAEEGDASAPRHPRHRVRLRSALLRAELTAIVGTIAVFVFFAAIAGGNGFLSLTGTRNYLEVAAEVGIIATPVTLLLIAGEFDLSVGSMVGAAEILFAYPAVYRGWPMLPSLLLAFCGACLVGLINGFLVTRTHLPSFIVTLAMMFALGGVTLATTNLLVHTVNITGIHDALDGDGLLPLFDGKIAGLSASIFWWLALTLVAAWVLDRTRWGNWIYATGGDVEAARKAGVPVKRVKMLLFVATALGATLVGVLVVFAADTADVNAGTGKEFQAATAAVIGGALISGGYGSPIGTAFGALLFGMVNQGFFYTSIDDNWFEAFVGAMLLLAVMINTYTRKVSLRQQGGRA